MSNTPQKKFVYSSTLKTVVPNIPIEYAFPIHRKKYFNSFVFTPT